MQELISVAQVGRSLGVHLLLATQKPGGVVDDKIFKVISLITMLSAFAVFYYHQYVYPKKYRESGRLQMICEKLIMQSY